MCIIVKVKVRTCIGKREDILPESVKAQIGDGQGWYIFNAPRPLPGEVTWEGDFIHGVFYSATSVFSIDARRLCEECVESGAVCLTFIEEEAMRKQLQRFYENHYSIKILVDDYDIAEVKAAYLQHLGVGEANINFEDEV